MVAYVSVLAGTVHYTEQMQQVCSNAYSFHSAWTCKACCMLRSKPALQCDTMQCNAMLPSPKVPPRISPCLVTQLCWKLLRPQSTEPPIHTENFRSGGADTCMGRGM
jgi:hypothetical protein